MALWYTGTTMGGPSHRPNPSDRLARLIADLEGGGAQRTMLTLANAFAGRGHLVGDQGDRRAR